MARSLYRYRYDYLTGKGFIPAESREFARQYTMSQLRSLPYLQNMIKSRGLFISNLRKRGYSNTEIRDRLYALYDTRDWLTPDGQLDVWAMLRSFRKKAIDEGEYKEKPRKGSHHPKGSGWSAGDRKSQKARSKEAQRKQAREDVNQEIIRAIQRGDQVERTRLEKERNRRFGY